MRNALTSGVLAGVLALGAAGQAVASCDYPTEDVKVPNGRIATYDQMIATQKAVKAYVAKMEAYLDCIEPRTQPTADSENPVSAREARINAARYDAAVEKMEAKADEFNEALRQYREDR